MFTRDGTIKLMLPSRFGFATIPGGCCLRRIDAAEWEKEIHRAADKALACDE